MAESAAGFEGGDERAKERIARLVQLGSLVEAMCSTDVMDNYTSREDLKTTVTKALEHNVRTSDGMNWNLHDLVYEALSEEWGRRDGEISDLWADDGPRSIKTTSQSGTQLTASWPVRRTAGVRRCQESRAHRPRRGAAEPGPPPRLPPTCPLVK